MSDNPILFVLLYCLCAPPGVIPVIALIYIARHYNFRNPFTTREDTLDV